MIAFSLGILVYFFLVIKDKGEAANSSDLAAMLATAAGFFLVWEGIPIVLGFFNSLGGWILTASAFVWALMN
jgi:hypothetical protein